MGKRERRGGRERLGGRKEGQKDLLVFLKLHAKSKNHTQAQISLLSASIVNGPCKAAALDVLPDGRGGDGGRGRRTYD